MGGGGEEEKTLPLSLSITCKIQITIYQISRSVCRFRCIDLKQRSQLKSLNVRTMLVSDFVLAPALRPADTQCNRVDTTVQFVTNRDKVC
jgi:hypothetical protein